MGKGTKENNGTKGRWREVRERKERRGDSLNR